MKIKGLVVDLSSQKIAVALSSEPLLHGLETTTIHLVDTTRFVIVEVPKMSVSSQRPSSWRMGDIISLRPWPSQPTLLLDIYTLLDGDLFVASSGEELERRQAGPAVAFSPSQPMPERVRPRATASNSAGLSVLAGGAQTFGMDLDEFEEPDDDEDEDHAAPYGANALARPTKLVQGEPALHG